MKIKNIIPIFMALFVVACSATGNNRNNNSGTTNPPEENLDLGLERAELSFYTDILDGALRDQLGTFSGFNIAPIRYRRESTDPLFDGLSIGGLDGTPAQASVTNDLVDQLYFTNASGAFTLARVAVQTRRGGVAGNVPQKFWRNNVITRLSFVTEMTARPTRPTIFMSETGTEEANIPSDFSLFVVSRGLNTARIQTNIGRTENLSAISAEESAITLLPNLERLVGILIRTNATSLEYHEIAIGGDTSSLNSARYFLKPNDRGVITYTLVE